MKKETIKKLVQVLANLLIVRYLLLEAIRLYKELPVKQASAEPGHALLLELEPQFYLGAASILMSASFGKPDTKIGKVAYQTLTDMLRNDIAQKSYIEK